MNLPNNKSRCTGTDCQHKQDCKRYLAINSDRMDVVRVISVMRPPEGECGYMIRVDGRHEQ